MRYTPHSILHAFPLRVAFILAAAAMLAGAAPGFDYPPFDTGHNYTGNPGGPGGGGPGGGGGGGDPVIIKTGNFAYDTLDWSFHQRGLPLEIRRSYHSDDFYDGPFGFGWHLGLMWTAIPVKSATQDFVIIRRGDGVRVTFTRDPLGSYVPEPGYQDTLSPQGAGWRLASGGGILYLFNAAGWPTRGEQDGFGVVFNYDAAGRLASITSDASQTLYFAYDPNYNIRRIYDWTGRETKYEYDAAGNLVAFVDREGYRMEYQYDANHNLLARKSRRGFTFPTNQYDSLRRVTTQQYADGKLTFQYKPDQNATTITNQANRATTYTYNSAGKPVEIEDPDHNVVRFTWDQSFNRTSYTDTGGRTTFYEYDALGRLTAVVQPSGSRIQYQYHPVHGLLSSVTSTDNVSYAYQYDANGRLMQVAMPGNQTASFLYNGNQITVNGPAGVSVYTLNQHGWIASVQKDGGPVESYTYDDVGNLVGSSRPGRSVTFAYTARDRLAAATDNVGSATYFFYNAENSLERVVYPDGSEDVFEYDPYNRLSNPLAVSGRLELLNFNPTEGVENEFLATVGRYVISEYFALVWNWGAVLAGLP